MLRRSVRNNGYPDERPFWAPPDGRRRRPIPYPIARVHIPLVVLEATSRVMMRYGEEGRECYIWWGGYFSANGDAQVVTALCPEVPTHFGRVYLERRDLSALHERLRTLDQVLVAELHTHPPGAGGQNDVDAANPAATYPGFVSIVVPDFAAPQFYDLRKSYVYEYIRANEWRELKSAEIERRFIIEEPFIVVRR